MRKASSHELLKRCIYPFALHWTYWHCDQQGRKGGHQPGHSLLALKKWRHKMHTYT